MNILIKNSFWSIVEMASNAILSFGLSIYIGRSFGIENLGIYSFVASTSAIAVAITNFGVTPYYLRRLAQGKFVYHHINELINIRILISTPIYALLMILIILLASRGNIGFEHMILIIFFGIINANMLIASVLNSQQKNGVYFLFSLTYKLGALLTILCGFLYDSFRFEYFIILLSFLAVVQSFIIVKLKIIRISLSLNFRRFSSRMMAIRKTLLIGLSGVFEVITNRIDILIIGYFLSESWMGAYSAAYSYFMIYTLLSLALTKVFFARFSFYLKNNIKRAREFLRLYFALTLLYGVISSILLYASSDFFIKMAYGESFKASIELAQGLSFAIIPMILGRLFGHVMNAVGSFNYAVYTSALGAMVSICVNFFLIENYQIWAPIYATIAAESIVALSLIVLFLKSNKLHS
jgi:O-antigen/teichoic acid export membrane protein